MTLVVAGFDGDEIFFIGDSAITNTSGSIPKTLLSGFKKIYAIPIIVHAPFFVREFRRYIPFQSYKAESVVALAGNTLIAQHILNTINEHLAKVRVNYSYDGEKTIYSLIRHCDVRNNQFYQERRLWDESELSYDQVMSAIQYSDLKDIIEYSIGEAVNSASKHILGEEDWKRIKDNEYLFSLSCPHKKENFLYRVVFDEEERAGVIKAIPKIESIQKGQLGIIGIKNFNEQLCEKYNELVITRSNISLEMLNCFEKIINNCNEQGFKGVAKPIIYKRYSESKLTKAIYIRQNGDWMKIDENDISRVIVDKNIELSFDNRFEYNFDF
ncbi:hypothetical protein I5590_10095 [Acinetobacter baumannii]|uniref:Uncharacterized protein n=2 Tax=Acinetobacter calcoaceticus/baumannii complex TaxID=909768 RepID=A0AB37A964_ACIBA|nr:MULTISPECIES: hypothetical protein [Acinetobacter calcoaceticus/baumannii complex]EKX2701010.1 hypothetical protein [Acinetobacter baumannii]EKY1320705.1 hypothetical protein [Acinetobacter baumannii]EKY1521990.1 hypothetical protein [Acinetobacter baumannii]KAB0455929.1 hypothetical protein EG248_07255 [Acinetobacter baumannii]MBE2425270.1 hypothetical protein [Acinetobacter baumannii]